MALTTALMLAACNDPPVTSENPTIAVDAASCEATNSCYVAQLPPVTDNAPLPPPPCGSLYRYCPDGSPDSDDALFDAGSAGDARGGARRDAGDAASDSSDASVDRASDAMVDANVDALGDASRALDDARGDALDASGDATQDTTVALDALAD
jgi:hypothetical protein